MKERKSEKGLVIFLTFLFKNLKLKTIKKNKNIKKNYQFYKNQKFHNFHHCIQNFQFLLLHLHNHLHQFYQGKF